MNRIMTSGAAAVALAASSLFAFPATADARASGATFATKIGDSSALFIQVGHDGHDYRPASYGYRDSRAYRMTENDRLSRNAIQACRAGIQREARRIGFRDVDFDSRAWAQQIGPAGFTVRFRDVEFEGRRHEFERSVSCTVRRGRVVDIDGLPYVRGGPRYADRGGDYRR